MKLSDKQKRFCKEYVIDSNYTQAAIRAGYSKRSAKMQGSRLMTNDDIKAYIAHLQEKVAKRLEVDADWIGEQFKILANADYSEIIKQMTNTTVSYKSLNEWPKELKMCIKQIKQTQNGVEVVFYDKVKALESLAKHIGYYKEDNKHEVKHSGLNLIIDMSAEEE